MRWLLFLILSFSAQGQVATVVVTNYHILAPCQGDTNLNCSQWAITNSVSVSSNQLIQILAAGGLLYSPDSADTAASVIKDGREALIQDFNKCTWVGPLKINFYCGIFTYKITPIEEPIQPGTGVVIPTDTTGPVQIILESSADMVNWTAAIPGTYGANTTNRFFRVRAVRQ